MQINKYRMTRKTNTLFRGQKQLHNFKHKKQIHNLKNEIISQPQEKQKYKKTQKQTHKCKIKNLKHKIIPKQIGNKQTSANKNIQTDTASCP